MMISFILFILFFDDDYIRNIRKIRKIKRNLRAWPDRRSLGIEATRSTMQYRGRERKTLEAWEGVHK